ncbi:hypothetical protein S40285_04778 [Stachybotrys chlorohalonatus IBT 40285]|uniref:F-box domain-containing protein n=1 Tax=Stachybotrys chlorohalonatus (strain IBT 40285) TaxID=1283841 RepID=A0A084QGQ6_STAC4|nr:hypothetical protein S40285_04778 [Stachybotrys chlorohalonata IBT 40285]
MLGTAPESQATGSQDPRLDYGGSSSTSQERFRSLSLSLPWRRSKTSIFTSEELNALEQAASELAIDDTLYANENPHPDHRYAQPCSGSIRRIFRRASVSLKGIAQRRPSLTIEGPAQDPRASFSRPTTANTTWSRLRHATAFRRSRSFYDLEQTADLRSPAHQVSQPCHIAIPGAGDEPPVIPMSGGAAAKAAAALQNDFILRQSLQTAWLRTPSSEDGIDRESGIGINAAIPGMEDDIIGEIQADAQDPSISRLDFITGLPTELATHVLEYLDAATLAKACAVSRGWNWVIASQHVWRKSCLRHTAATYATSGPIKPGTGLGIPPVHPDNDWRDIYRIKQDLSRRWRDGKARPVYLNGHLDSIYCIQFDEHKIITGSRDKTIRIWDMHTFDCKMIIGPPEVVVNTLLLYDDDGLPTHYAASADNQRTRESMPTPLAFTTHHKASILCLQYDDRILVTGSSDSTCIVHDLRNGYQPVRRLRHHTAAVLDLAFDDKHIVTCSKDISICVWDRATGNLLRQLRGHTGPVNAVQMRGNTIVSCSGDFRVKLWNIDTGKNIREFAGHTKGLACSQFSEDGRYVASAGNDKVIRIWDANTGECVREMRAHEGLVRSLHIDSVSGRLISGSYDRDIKVWDMETGHQLLDFPRWHSSWVLSAKCDYRRIVSTGQDPKILIMDFGADIEGVQTLESKDALAGQFHFI